MKRVHIRELQCVFFFLDIDLSVIFYVSHVSLSVYLNPYPYVIDSFVVPCRICRGIYQTFLKAQQEKTLVAVAVELDNMSPAPMNSMLDKQPRAEALAKRVERKRKLIVDVPPTTLGNLWIPLHVYYRVFRLLYRVNRLLSLQIKTSIPG